MQTQSALQRARQWVRSPRGAWVIMWVVFFVFWGGLAATYPYLGLFYESRGLQGSQIGQLNSIRSFINFISSILFAFLSDVLKRHKLVLRLCILGMIVVLLLYPAAFSFMAFIPIIIALSIFLSPTFPILDETTLSALENPRDYGRVRVGGTYGWGVVVLATGFLVGRLSIGLNTIFYLNIIFMILLFGLTFIMPDVRAAANHSLQRPTLKDLWQLVSQPGILMVVLFALIWGLAESGIGNFLFLHIKHLGGSSGLMGISQASALIGEIIIFSRTNQIQARLGAKRMMVFSFIVQVLWFGGLSLIRNPLVIPFFQFFGGASYGLMQAGSVAYVDACAPKKLGTTAQAIRGGVLLGLGLGIGSIINGSIYQQAGSVVLFRSTAGMALGGLLIGLAVLFFTRKKRTA